ncbi:MAG: acylphosphatase [Fimbriimonadaceae bacterium]|nr:acylphosphatase [Chitinophagales bacterium]
MILHRRIKITGKVQGVFYRASAKQIADTLNITGWIRNDADGNVIAYAVGENENINKFIEWCRQGPPMAEVIDVYAEEYISDNVNGFEIRK